MIKHYTDEKNTLILIALLKANGIKRVIASPGTTNIALIASLQSDPFFEVYSSVDERSAAYIACGIAAETQEPVVISCTGATASRNYASGLTEAFYRKLPVLAITSTQSTAKIGHNVSQVLDRSSIQNDVAKLSVTLPIVKDNNDAWECEIKVNQAILELSRNGGGPVHINLPTIYSTNFETKTLPQVRVIKRHTTFDDFPELPKGKIAIFAGSHSPMSKAQTDAIDSFCEVNDAVVFCDHTSNYKGKYRMLFSLVACQTQLISTEYIADLIIHIGDVTGDSFSIKTIGKKLWRLSEDGEIRDTFQNLERVFDMPDESFFSHYSQQKGKSNNNYLTKCKSLYAEVFSKIPELPFSNIWIASQLAHKIPDNSVVHLAILNSLRSWNLFDFPNTVRSFSNVGGFGIDGCISTLVGASLCHKDKLYFGIAGDLAFFYDMNVFGNRHFGNNIRILLINNGVGVEFRNYNHKAAQFEQDADKFIAAAGHFGNKSPNLVKNYIENLGFDYMSASSKNEFESIYSDFISTKTTDKPIVFEVFTNGSDDSDALKAIMNIEGNFKGRAKELTKKMLGENSFKMLKNALKK